MGTLLFILVSEGLALAFHAHILTHCSSRDQAILFATTHTLPPLYAKAPKRLYL